MPKINRDALTRQGLDPVFVSGRAVDYLADRMFLSPVLALLPAALLLVLARQTNRRRRVEWAVLAVLVCLIAIAAVAVQGNWFAYHSAALPVCAAALWGLAVARWYGAFGTPPLFFTAVTVLYGVLVPFTSSAPVALPSVAAAWLASGAALAAALADLRLARRNPAPTGTAARPRIPVALTALAGVVCLAVTVWPGSPHRMNRGDVVSTNAGYLQASEVRATEAAALRREIPDGAPVLYLAFGDVAYFVGHPVQCRYPIPTFLQRVEYVPDASLLASHAENARCLTENPAPYAVLQPSWFSLGQVDERVSAEFRELYACPSEESPQTVVCRLR
jgi:hypothetical protein